ncbi:hypothetical protein JRQ81_000112 [Phrynocephalus forsythii]|uniref:G-protein coupled receptors family 1 profile domain-containing protein n=1 Tax=Phrynocephalus forsythii TaxID=171643 RepID=A0A9Q1B727_9SAUR|nr:hypothetical protein JRQ81_000112 [Phrynocephalus forsythii]
MDLLKNLFFSGLCCSTVIVPQTLVNFWSEKKAISFSGCAAQFYFYAVFATVECLLLSAMDYDGYVAIFNLLLYPLVMLKKPCFSPVLASYLAGCANGVIHASTTFRLPFCNSNVIDHFFCDVP